MTIRFFKGFTLAEVLITLGIIGVVAAMTIPMLINHYNTKELEIRFKEADSILQQALKKTANEAGYDSISDLTIQGRTVTDTNLAELKKGSFRNIKSYLVATIYNYYSLKLGIYILEWKKMSWHDWSCFSYV